MNKQQFIEKSLKEFTDQFINDHNKGEERFLRGLFIEEFHDFLQSKLSECWDMAGEVGIEQGIRSVGKWHKLPEYKEMVSTKNIDGTGGLVNCGCSTCGGKPVTIRGEYPGLPDRQICPTCTREVLESILSGCNNRDAATDTNSLTSKQEDREEVVCT